MGFELANFVEGQSVSRHLICSICHGVLENPVQTACEHLFCEDELIEWLCHKSSCPVCQAEIDPEDIVRAPRAIVGLINDLERYCDHAKYGCPWTGTSDAVVSVSFVVNYVVGPEPSEPRQTAATSDEYETEPFALPELDAPLAPLIGGFAT